MSRFVMIAAFSATLGLASCAPGIEEPVSPRAALRFDSELAGLTPGPRQSCLPPRSTATVVAARNGVLLFREGRTVYANRTNGGCDALADDQYTLVTNNFSGALCDGSIARVVDLTSGGGIRGACALGDFTPYRKR